MNIHEMNNADSTLANLQRTQEWKAPTITRIDMKCTMFAVGSGGDGGFSNEIP